MGFNSGFKGLKETMFSPQSAPVLYGRQNTTIYFYSKTN